MFTGIIREVGVIRRNASGSGAARVEVEVSAGLAAETDFGESIAVNGVCLTAAGKNDRTLCFDAVQSTLKMSNLKRLKKGSLVNIEPSLRINEKLGGHFVLGHVDEEAKLRRMIRGTGFHRMEILFSSNARPYLIPNGSVAIDGVSLTVKSVRPQVFTIDVIPFTFSHTNLQYKRAGDWVNIEYDYLLKRRPQESPS
ncbi:MAG: riboflavin synthase [Candidatus Omnitrophica bacterium]|nr:riboflavin synthase [Candidatus Omnitrophota bacterium]